MIDRLELDNRLKGWAQEYGGGKYENVGWSGRNLLQTLVDHKGFVPSARGYIPVPIRSAADEVENVVNHMDSGEWRMCACVVRCDYFAPHLAMDERLNRLRRIGVNVSRTRYYEMLAQAKAYIAGALATRAVA